MKTASGPVHGGQEPTTGLGMADGAGAGKMHSALSGVRIPSSAVTS
ncbi:putative RNA polymerase sigma factor [Streptomyces viridochromogenes Tue57]|uniref:Putative RNA polymerase sigma factor n=1 Tax=Streptomyces viridochromogenes Tue57 TaxID=1160705 RepID=L8PLU4_STRVR|nr:putative RNA polymerase sigma factor [Streptomyces viridochromogenes Tue57]